MGDTYERSSYTGKIRIRDRQTGEVSEKTLKRAVHKNNSIDPDLVVPKGTVINGKPTKADQTNMQRMQNGNAPVIAVKDAKGQVTYDSVELHHVTAQERLRGSQYFNSRYTDGTIAELRHSVHKKYDKQLHSSIEKNTSFRTNVEKRTDKDGNTVRVRVKSDDAVQYEKFRKQYWKDRAAEFSNRQSQKNKSENGEKSSMAKSWELTPEQKAGIQQSSAKLGKEWAKKNSSTTGSAETKGQRERSITGERASQSTGKAWAGESAGKGGQSAGKGGQSAGKGGRSAGSGGHSAGSGGHSAGSGGRSAGSGGRSAGSGGHSR